MRKFTGRQAELRALDTMLVDARRDVEERAAMPVVAIVGGAGVGKSALAAAHWAHRVKGRFTDGQVYLDLHGYSSESPLQPEEALSQLLRALGTPAERIPPRVDEQSALLQSVVAGRQVLFLLAVGGRRRPTRGPHGPEGSGSPGTDRDDRATTTVIDIAPAASPPGGSIRVGEGQNVSTHRHTLRRSTGRAAALTVGALTALSLGTPAAWAHVEATATPATAGAANATIAFSAEAESDTAGIAKVKVQLPAGLAPADVTLATGPSGWTFSRTADGYSVTGPALRPGEDLAYAIRVTKLPDKAGTVLFKTVETYTDGKENAWIEEPGPDGAEPENPAPAITLAAAAGGSAGAGGTGSSAPATASPPATSTPGTDATAAPSAAAGPDSATDTSGASGSSDDGGSAPLVITLVVVVVLLAGAGGYYLRRRKAGATPPTT